MYVLILKQSFASLDESIDTLTEKLIYKISAALFLAMKRQQKFFFYLVVSASEPPADLIYKMFKLIWAAFWIFFETPFTRRLEMVVCKSMSFLISATSCIEGRNSTLAWLL